MLQRARFVFFLLAGVFAGMTLLGLLAPCAHAPLPLVMERYDPDLGRITSVAAAEAFIRSRLPPNPRPADIALAVEDFAARRFLHSYSTFSFCDNWLAYLAGGLHYDLKVPIDADDVLRFPVAFCTQNTTVMQALFERFGIKSASAIFMGNKHIAPVANLDGRWALYDGDMEPLRTDVVFVEDLPKAAYDMYANRSSHLYSEDFARVAEFAANSGQIALGPPTRLTSRNGRIFQRVTWFTSWFGWAVFLVFAGLCHGVAARRMRSRGGSTLKQDTGVPLPDTVRAVP